MIKNKCNVKRHQKKEKRKYQKQQRILFLILNLLKSWITHRSNKSNKNKLFLKNKKKNKNKKIK